MKKFENHWLRRSPDDRLIRLPSLWLPLGLSLLLAVHSEGVTALRLDFAQGFVSRSAASSHAFCISSPPASVHTSHRSLQQILARSSFYGDFVFFVFLVFFGIL